MQRACVVFPFFHPLPVGHWKQKWDPLGWREGSVEKSTGCPSRGRGLIPSSHVEAHNCPSSNPRGPDTLFVSAGLTGVSHTVLKERKFSPFPPFETTKARKGGGSDFLKQRLRKTDSSVWENVKPSFNHEGEIKDETYRVTQSCY